ncbi:MAG: bacterio-opsin activator domain-containing protein [Haloferacaceae archaeon]
MTSIAEFTLPPSGFPLGRVFDGRPDVTLELDRVVPSGDTVMPYFWVRDPDGDLDGILQVFDGLPELRSITLMEDLGQDGLYRAEWDPEHMGIMRAIPATGVTVVSASGSKRGWTFELRAPTGAAFAEFQRYCAANDIDVSLARLRQLSETAVGNEYGLTPRQREALLLAYDEDYYSEPRGTDQATLADRLGITRQALSSRLRRGYRTLLENTLLRERDGGPE